MSKLAIVLVLLGAWFSGITQISRSNELRRKAQLAYSQQEFGVAAQAWAELLQLQPDPDPAIRLNLAHALRQQNQKLKAAREYQQVVRKGSLGLQSVAHLQLGNMLAQARDFEQALTSYKAALKADAGNNQARYNYELLKKYLDQDKEPETEENEEQKEQQNTRQQQQNQAQQSRPGGQDQQGRPGPGGNHNPLNQGSRPGSELGQNKTETDTSNNQNQPLPPQNGQKGVLPGEETSVHRLEKIRMTEERARALLNTMRNAEQQYLQQLPRQLRSRDNPNKPNW